jgi:hypothetical protein
VAIWLIGQCGIFVRNRELFAQEPFSVTADEPFTDELTELAHHEVSNRRLAARIGRSLIERAKALTELGKR